MQVAIKKKIHDKLEGELRRSYWVSNNQIIMPGTFNKKVKKHTIKTIKSSTNA